MANFFIPFDSPLAMSQHLCLVQTGEPALGRYRRKPRFLLGSVVTLRCTLSGFNIRLLTYGTVLSTQSDIVNETQMKDVMKILKALSDIIQKPTRVSLVPDLVNY